MGRDSPQVKREVILAFAAACLLVTTFCVVAAQQMWPMIDSDGPAYFPPVVEQSLGRSLTNPIWLPPLNDSIDGPGGRRFIYHGFLYAIVVGDAGRLLGGGAEGSVHAAYVLHWIVAVAGALGILAVSETDGFARILLAGLLPLAMLGLSVAWHGRMEPLALLLVALGCYAWHRVQRPWGTALVGAIVALLFFTSPAEGILAGCALLGAIVARRDALVSQSVAVALAGATAGAAAAVLAYPYPIADWLGGIIRHGRMNLSLPLWRGFFPTWISRPDLPLLAVAVGLLAIAAGSRLVAFFGTLPRARASMFVIASGLFLVGLVRIAFLKTEASYNAVVWMPAFMCVALADRTSWRNWVTAFALLLPVAGLARSSVVLAHQVEPEAVGFNEVRAKIEQLTPFGCAVSGGFWLAVDDPRKVSFTPVPEEHPRYLVRQQTYTGQVTPPAVPGYKLVENRFGSGVAVLGVPITRTPGGWDFAVYQASP